MLLTGLHTWRQLVRSGIARSFAQSRRRRALKKRRGHYVPAMVELLEDRVLLTASSLNPSFSDGGDDGTVTTDVGHVLPSEDIGQAVFAYQSDGDRNQHAAFSLSESHPRRAQTGPIAFGESRVVIGPHHAEAGHPESPDTHFFAETGDEHHFAWQDQVLGTPDVIDIFYDFRASGSFENLITPGQQAAAEVALQVWEDATGGNINFSSWKFGTNQRFAVSRM